CFLAGGRMSPAASTAWSGRTCRSPKAIREMTTPMATPRRSVVLWTQRTRYGKAALASKEKGRRRYSHRRAGRPEHSRQLAVMGAEPLAPRALVKDDGYG